jgi:hypothetical protein
MFDLINNGGDVNGIGTEEGTQEDGNPIRRSLRPRSGAPHRDRPHPPYGPRPGNLFYFFFSCFLLVFAFLFCFPYFLFFSVLFLLSYYNFWNVQILICLDFGNCLNSKNFKFENFVPIHNLFHF